VGCALGGSNPQGVYGEATGAAGAGIYGTASGGAWAGYFSGNAHVTLTFTAGVKTFEIDHPCDPYNKILRHVSIESPDPVVVYYGRACLCEGCASIVLPKYFDKLTSRKNREISLTPVKGWSPLFLDGEIGESFVVCSPAGYNKNQEFSWSVMAVRNDRFIQCHPVMVEYEKKKKGEFRSKGLWSSDEIEQMEKGEWRP
jgi:hypothetical protein